MKNKILGLLVGVGFSALGVMSSDAAVTLTFATQTGSANGPNGIPVVDSSGAAILNSSNSLYASIGFVSGVNTTAAQYLANFTPIDNTPIVPNLVSGSTPRNGLFNAQDFNSATNAYPAGFSAGQTAYVLIGNAPTLSQSTAIALFQVGTFGTIDAVNGLNQTFALTSASVPVIGTLRSVTTQPLAGNTYAQGVVLTSVVPEPSAALLGAIGALGLLRRRR